jgi:outer membrane lipoprotein SlyB
MKRTALIFGLCVALGAVSATPAAAQERKKEKDSGNSELVGRLLGAGVGALLGSQVGGGKGKLAAVAVGALAGAWIGGELANRLTQSDQQGIARTTNTALDTGESQTWTNPDTGVKTNVQVKERTVERVPAASEGLKSRPWETPPLEYVNAHYQVVRGSNVRSGPGTDYAVMNTLRAGERVVVVGRVRGQDWYMVSEDGLGYGYVHGSLIKREPYQPPGDSPLYVEARDAAPSRSVAERNCSVITQEIILPDGTAQARDVRACQQPDGTWVAV